jgi:hypothetical protein
MTDLYLPLTEAQQKYKLDLYSLIELGKIKSIMLTTYPGVVLVNDEDIRANLPREERTDYQQFANLRGARIGIREAGRKYNLSSVTISQWVSHGLIREYGKESVRGGYKLLIDEADVAYCVYIRSRNPGRGHWLFNKDGTPRK